MLINKTRSFPYNQTLKKKNWIHCSREKILLLLLLLLCVCVCVWKKPPNKNSHIKTIDKSLFETNEKKQDKNMNNLLKPDSIEDY